MRAAVLAALLPLSSVAPDAVLAQNTGAGGQGKENFQNLRSFTVRNGSDTVV